MDDTELIARLPDPPTPDPDAPPVTTCPLCMGSGKDPEMDHMEDGLYGPVEVRDYCRMCEGEKVVSTEGVWSFVERLYRSEVDAADPDAPPVYVPPEGHYAPVLGENVPDGWEGRYINGSGGFDWSAKSCRSTGRDALFEVRRVPAPEPATEWVPLTKLVGRTIKGETEPVHRTDSPNPSTEFPGWRWRPITTALWQRFPDGTLNIDTAQVLVLAEGER